MVRVLIVVGAVWTLACGGGQTKSAVTVDADFKCNKRKVSYDLTGGFGAASQGLEMSCEGGRPVLKKYRQEDEAGEPARSEHPLSSAEFETFWQKIDSTGWRHLEDCEYVGGDDDPVYGITIADTDKTTKVTCAGKTLQFPHDRIVNELDLKAAAPSGN